MISIFLVTFYQISRYVNWKFKNVLKSSQIWEKEVHVDKLLSLLNARKSTNVVPKERPKGFDGEQCKIEMSPRCGPCSHCHCHCICTGKCK